MRVLSLDIGRNKTGVALSETELNLVTPLKPLFCPLNSTFEDKWFDSLLAILKKYVDDVSEIGVAVLGSWVDREYRNLEMKKLVHKVMGILKEKTNWEIVLVRESYTSVESRQLLRGMGVKRKRIYRSIDSYAASLLLIDYLELIKPFRVEK